MVWPVVSREHRRSHTDSTSSEGPLALRLGVTVEEVDEVSTLCSAVEFRKHKPELVQLAEWVAKEADQDPVAILVDGGMELAVGKETP